MLIGRREVGDRLHAVPLTALAGKIQFRLDGEPVIDRPFGLDAKVGGKPGGIAGAKLVATAAAEVGDAETAMYTEPRRLSKDMSSLEECQKCQDGKYFSHKKSILIIKD